MKKTTTHDVGHPGPRHGLGQAQKCDRVKYTEYYPLILSIRYRLTPRQGQIIKTE